MTDTATGYKILLVDDDQFVLEGLQILLDDNYSTVSADSGPAAIEIVKSDDAIAVVVMDIKMPGMSGLEAAREIRLVNPGIRIIFHTGFPGQYSEDQIDKDEKPFDYVQKGGAVSRLTRSVRNAFDSFLSHSDQVQLISFAADNLGLIGNSQGMQEVYRSIAKIAASDSKVMILGETGTGKELVARGIHKLSSRRDRHLVIFNCNHKAPDLVESELFGHAKGSFTGAVSDNIGLFEYANGGTIFLDEVGDLDITTQAKILRVLESGEFQVVGKSTELKKTDVRILCATHRDLELMVAENKFREDLYYRLKGIIITVPPLRNRKEDIPLLTQRFLDRATVERNRMPKYIDATGMGILLSQEWPGNVRQLQDTIESLVVLTDSDVIFAEDVQRYLGEEPSGVSFQDQPGLSERTLQFRRNCIIEALHESEGNVSSAARLLQVDSANLRKWIKNYGIETG